ncbi:DUF2156 domain-containing protein [Treponema sp. OMZ 790]|uniref:DUF2156 domain-containing protein n=1 Tax=unclassified Treponema TaxID=2638727 RepID=UPI0020A3FBEF|nr:MULTISPECIES: phosphatidylglycerol lysyltransferase domain-containing protein [unclassified Treponema]UTC70192.1 DUF2156 domain-containing protein [Treponema sp. OMZ 790]UTC72907.1 DUF2156 domain-containing protein [Treponema sp. OMZ 791]
MNFPNFLPISDSMHKELYPLLNNLSDGISEFTFISLYLHRLKYGYEISRLPSATFVVTGCDAKGKFFLVMGGIPQEKELCFLLENYGRWKNISQTLYDKFSDYITKLGYEPYEDRDNEDYLYTRESLALLAGKALHKKRNFANGFENAYAWEVRPLNEQNKVDACAVLDEWHANRGENQGSDYDQCIGALEMLTFTNLEGWIVYVDGKPAAWSLGEYIANGKMFLVHFEKAIDTYRGVYQFINRATARALPETVEFINREQDLGNEGLRQAKMTYRPCGFVKKYCTPQKKLG